MVCSRRVQEKGAVGERLFCAFSFTSLQVRHAATQPPMTLVERASVILLAIGVRNAFHETGLAKPSAFLSTALKFFASRFVASSTGCSGESAKRLAMVRSSRLS